jgi:hypothetical protein
LVGRDWNLDLLNDLVDEADFDINFALSVAVFAEEMVVVVAI